MEFLVLHCTHKFLSPHYKHLLQPAFGCIREAKERCYLSAVYVPVKRGEVVDAVSEEKEMREMSAHGLRVNHLSLSVSSLVSFPSFFFSPQQQSLILLRVKGHPNILV